MNEKPNTLTGRIPLPIRKIVAVFLAVIWLIINIPVEGFYREDWREVWNMLKARKS